MWPKQGDAAALCKAAIPMERAESRLINAMENCSSLVPCAEFTQALPSSVQAPAFNESVIGVVRMRCDEHEDV